jgi:hypothetical protein
LTAGDEFRFGASLPTALEGRESVAVNTQPMLEDARHRGAPRF